MSITCTRKYHRSISQSTRSDPSWRKGEQFRESETEEKRAIKEKIEV